MDIRDNNNILYSIEEVTSNKESLYGLLLLADETIEAIDKYLALSTVFKVSSDGLAIGVFCLFNIDSSIVEIKNIAISDVKQSLGIGSAVIAAIIKIVKSNGFSTLIVGTSDTGVDQIRFYERNGFVRYAVKKNFFVENYSAPIIENGIQLKDMIMLKLTL